MILKHLNFVIDTECILQLDENLFDTHIWFVKFTRSKAAQAVNFWNLNLQILRPTRSRDEVSFTPKACSIIHVMLIGWSTYVFPNFQHTTQVSTPRDYPPAFVEANLPARRAQLPRNFLRRLSGQSCSEWCWPPKGTNGKIIWQGKVDEWILWLPCFAS